MHNVRLLAGAGMMPLEKIGHRVPGSMSSTLHRWYEGLPPVPSGKVNLTTFILPLAPHRVSSTAHSSLLGS
jgi:hypothetical protein